jgi:excisionase family DNA binding protein
VLRDSPLLRPRQAAELLQVAESTVRRWLADGTLPRYRIGRSVRTSRAAVEALIARSRVAIERRGRAGEPAPAGFDFAGFNADMAELLNLRQHPTASTAAPARRDAQEVAGR